MRPDFARAIGTGDDTDTLAALPGAMSGAHLGFPRSPSHPVGQLEEQGKGEAYLRELASASYQATVRM